MQSRFSIGIATVVMLVLLRLNIGWHFFSEGAKHYADPHWTSEPVLRNAKGPLAPWYHAHVPDFHGFEGLLHGRETQSGTHGIEDWTNEIQQDWDAYRQKFSEHYGLDPAQQQQAEDILHQYQAKIRDWAADNQDALATHIHQWQRKETTREKPDGDMPFQKKRTAEEQSMLSGEAGGWRADLRSLERKYDTALDALLNDAQHRQIRLVHHINSIDLVDGVMTYAILGIGLLLLVGLFTRLACLAGALFLFSVVMMQPFWVSETQPTFNQYVEMFALLALATTGVGRWGGLDFFLANLFRGSSSTKGKTDVSKS